MTRNAGDLSDREVARVLRKSVRTIQRWCQAGKLPGAYHAGRSWRIPRSALDAAHRGAVDRLALGPVAASLPVLRATTALLERIDGDLADADMQSVERLLAAVDALRAKIAAVGKHATERRRALERDRQLALRARRRGT
jgi:excisionase family DNA binding protein